MTQQILAELEQSRLVAIIRTTDTDLAITIGQELIDSGVTLLEVALTTPNALSAIETLVSYAHDRAWVGSGTVLTVGDVKNSQAAGAQFIVTPVISESLDAAVSEGLPVMCGAYSPTEIYTAHTRGASAIKVFPASAGGPQYLKAVRDPLPNIKLIPVGGVSLETIPGYLAVGAHAFGVGGPLTGGIHRADDMPLLRDRAQQFITACRKTSDED